MPDFLIRPAVVFAGRRVCIDDFSRFRVDDQHYRVVVTEQAAIAFFTFTQGCLGLRSHGDFGIQIVQCLAQLTSHLIEGSG